MAKIKEERYKSINDCIELNGCQLITTFEEYVENKMHCKSRYNITALCGHQNSVQYDMFRAKNVE